MTPDVNVLVAASRSDHPHHRCAMDWLEGALVAAARGDRLRLLPMVGAGFLRLVTHPRVFIEPTPLAGAQAFLAALLSADGWIAAAVLARSECLATFDRDFVSLLPARQLVLLKP